VETDLAVPISVLRALTAAPGTAAPDVSLIVPVKVAVCDQAEGEKTKANVTNKTPHGIQRNKLFGPLN
jgi:hypothetical protein